MTDGTGLILCGCGPNIGDSIDLKRLADSFSQENEISWIIQHDLPCSKNGRQVILQRLEEQPVRRLVVAGCSPKEREQTFRDVMIEAGLNPFMLQMTNIREHCAWVESDREKATVKAERLIKAAIERVKHHEPIVQNKISVNPNVLVIGAGIAGMEAALLAAREGCRVHLVEKSGSIGGLVPLLNELYPSMECSSCALEPLMDEILHNENIDLHLLSEISSVRGFYGNFHIDIRTRGRGVDPSKCMGCGMCIEACGIEVPNAINSGFDNRKAIYNEYEGAMPNVPRIDWDKCARSSGSDCEACMVSCMMGAVDLDEKETCGSIEAGAIVVATGSERVTLPAGDIFSAFQFERLVNPGGGTGGEIVLRSGEAPASVAIVDEGGDCLSRMSAVKTALTALEKSDRTKITLIIKGELPAGEKNDRHFSVLEDSSDVEIRVLDRHQPVMVDDEKNTVFTGEEIIFAEMIVVCHGTKGAKLNVQLAVLLGTELDEEGFIRASTELLEPASSGIPGIFVAGSAAAPVTANEAILQGSAAAGRALSLLRPGTDIELNPFTSHVIEKLCSICGTCVSSCPYGAVVRGEDNRPFVEEALCQGCGICSSSCPSGAMRTRHYSMDQLMAEVGSLCYSEEN